MSRRTRLDDPGDPATGPEWTAPPSPPWGAWAALDSRSVAERQRDCDFERDYWDAKAAHHLSKGPDNP